MKGKCLPCEMLRIFHRGEGTALLTTPTVQNWFGAAGQTHRQRGLRGWAKSIYVGYRLK